MFITKNMMALHILNISVLLQGYNKAWQYHALVTYNYIVGYKLYTQEDMFADQKKIEDYESQWYHHGP